MKGRLKLSGGLKLASPKDLTTRPTSARVREAVMNILSKDLKGSNWLDLCSGTGVMSCEALKRGATIVVAIERVKKTAQLCKSNLAKVNDSINGHSSIWVFQEDAVDWLNRNFSTNRSRETYIKKNNLFDLIYLDPPYSSTIYSAVLTKLLEKKWVKENATVICEYSSRHPLDIPKPWIEKDRRSYGETALLLLTPPKEYSSCTDSKPPQTNQSM